MFSFLQLAVFLFGLARAATPEDPYRVEVADVTLAPNGVGNIRVTLVVPADFHVYTEMVEVTVNDAGGLAIGPASYPPGMMREDPAAPGTQRETYEDDVLVDLPVTAPGTVGTHAVSLHARYQGCKKTLCYLPHEEDITAIVTVAGTPVAPAEPGAPAELAAPVELGAPVERGANAADSAAETDVIFTAPAVGVNEVRVHADLQGEWHINRAFVSLTLVDADGYTLGEPLLPPGEKSGSPADGSEREDYTHDLDLVAPITGPPGKATVKVEVGWQACKGASLCKMPDYKTIEVPVEIDPAAPAPTLASVVAAHEGATGASAEASPASAPAGGASASGFGAAAEQGGFALVLVCFLAGIGVSFTPCVLPMVPITMGLIGARGAGSRVQAFSLSATYVLGLTVVYSALGVFAGVTGMLFGSWLQSAVVVFSIAGFFVVMGFSMFGFFDVGVPSFIASRLQGKAGGGYAGALVLGVIGAVLAGPCSGPVVASILALIGKEGEIGLGAGLMFAFSLGMGMIFLVTGAASGWLPQRGAWMVTVKKGFGIILWLGAIYYAAPHLSTTVTALLTAGVLLTTGVFGWPDPDDGEGVMTVRGRQLYAVVAGIIGAYLLLGTLLQQGFILPAMSLAGTGGAAAEAKPVIPWVRTEAEAIKLAQASGKPMMIDFTAEWCAACHEMERFTYTDPRVIAAMEGFVPVMLDCTKSGDPEIVALQKKYGVSGLPTVVFAMPDGRILNGTVGYVKADDFVPELQKALEARG